MRRLALLWGLAVLACAPSGPDGAPEGADPGPDAVTEAAADAAAASPAEVAGASSGYVDTPDGERIHYLEAGTTVGRPGGGGHARSPRAAPALLLVPGWTLSAEIWEPQIGHFARTRRVVAMDPRAQGRSSKARDGLYAAARARDIRSVVEELGLEPVVLVGWSMGVSEVVSYVDQFGTDGVAALVLVDGLAGFDFDGQIAPAFLDWIAAFVHDRRSATETFIREMYRTPRSEEYLAAMTEHALRTPTDAAATLVVGQARSDHRPALARIDRPTLVAIAPGGPWTALYEEMAGAIPGARLERFEGAGHALFVDQPERFNAAVEELLREIAAANP